MQNSYILNTKEPTITLDEIQFSEENKSILVRFLREFNHIEKLKEYGLPVDNKILFYGHTGCGKTVTARAIAHKLGKNIIILDLGEFVSSRLGETSKNIKALFQKASREKALLFLDEFDSIGKMRDANYKDSGEMKRLVNTVIQQIDYLSNDVLLIAATNYKKAIDSALLRRFQLKLKFELPSNMQLDIYYEYLLLKFSNLNIQFDRVYNVSYAEAKYITYREVKNKIIEIEEEKLEQVKETIA